MVQIFTSFHYLELFVRKLSVLILICKLKHFFNIFFTYRNWQVSHHVDKITLSSNKHIKHEHFDNLILIPTLVRKCFSILYFLALTSVGIGSVPHSIYSIVREWTDFANYLHDLEHSSSEFLFFVFFLSEPF